MAELLAGGDAALTTLRDAAHAVAKDAARLDALARPLAELRLAAPVPRPGKVVAIGRNYADHAAEGGAAVPSAPLIVRQVAVLGHRARR